jgi:hypothetical protein
VEFISKVTITPVTVCLKDMPISMSETEIKFCTCNRIATGYGLDGPGIESRWGRVFPPVQTGPGAHPASCTMVTGSFPGVKCGRGVLLTAHPLLVPRSWKSRAIRLPPIWATTGTIVGLLYFTCNRSLYLTFMVPCIINHKIE